MPFSSKIQVAGFVWYEEADYPEILRVMVDADKLPRNWKLWHKQATENLRSFEGHGGRAVKAVLKPKAFISWCAIRNLNVDAKARALFANEQARNEITGRGNVH